MRMGKICVDSRSKNLIYFSIAEIQAQISRFKTIFKGRTFCRAKCVKNRPNVEPRNHKNDSTIVVFRNFWLQTETIGRKSNDKHSVRFFLFKLYFILNYA